MEKFIIPFNKFHLTGKEESYISDSLKQEKLSGANKYTKLSEKFLEDNLKIEKVFLTPSCTAALEMTPLLLDLKPGDEVIMPSFTFVSTANAFVLRGVIPVFVEIHPQTFNIDENKIEESITDKTKAIMVVHYAGVACHMDKILEIAKKYNLYVIEDAAHAIGAKYKDKYLGTIGDLGTFSFHDTKNITCGEGGALLINNPNLIERSEIIREKGTNRNKFFRGEVDKYTWVDVGSSFLLSEVSAAFLFAQLENLEEINQGRIEIWNKYWEGLKKLEDSKLLNLPEVPDYATHNAHIFFLVLANLDVRSKLINFLKENGISSVFHYVPLHNSPAGLRYGKTLTKLTITEDLADRLLRLPLYFDLKNEEVSLIIEKINLFFEKKLYEN